MNKAAFNRLAIGVSGALILLITNWVAEILKGSPLFVPWLFKAEQFDSPVFYWGVTVALCVIWAAAALWFNRLIRLELPFRMISEERKNRLHKVLITAVSSNNGWGVRMKEEMVTLVLGDEQVPIQNGIDDLMIKIRSINDRCNLLVPLQGFAQHLGTLKQIYLLASEQSFEEAGQIKQIFEAISQGKIDIIIVPDLDFESIRSVYDALSGITQSLEKAGIADRDVVVDITAGQKPATVAMAMITLHSEIHAQYVQGTRVLPYNMVYQPRVRH